MFVIKRKNHDQFLCRKPKLKFADIDNCETYRSRVAAQSAIKACHNFQLPQLGIKNYNELEITPVKLTLI